MNVVFRAEARADALQAFDWYEARKAGLGREFRDALDVTVARISEYAASYAAGERGLRRALVTRFPYAVYFRVEGNTAVVVGVIHGKRHPRVWTTR